VNKWIIFGFSNYLSDIFDNIHANRGKIKKIVLNITPTEKQLENLNYRLSLLKYNVSIIKLESFQPENDDNYFYGFTSGRNTLINSLKKRYKMKFSNIIHPKAYIGSNVKFSEGIFIGPNSVIAPNCKIGSFSLINRSSTVGHDTVIGDFSTIGPGVAIAGMVKLGNHTTVGIGATIVDRINIGNNSVVGAGSVVLQDVQENVVVVGVPAKMLKKNR
jgi:sugar O-acyltransferase (sialic acid O-acetyltransferase NeuD family)